MTPLTDDEVVRQEDHEHRPIGTITARTGPHYATCSCGARIRATHPGSAYGEWVLA